MLTFTFEATGWASLVVISIHVSLDKGAYFVKTFRQKSYCLFKNKYFNISLSYLMNKKNFEGFLQLRKDSRSLKNSERKNKKKLKDAC